MKRQGGLISFVLSAGFLLITNPSRGDELVDSAWRSPSESFEDALRRHRGKSEGRSIQALIDDAGSVYDSRLPFSSLDLSVLPEWESLEEVVESFEAVRDLRYLYTSNRPYFSRRISWLYPDDGCFARAAKMRKLIAEDQTRPMPYKIFSFGELRVDTDNHPRGSVGWWYHVVPAVRVGSVAYVFDPAIDPERPLELEEWLMTQVDDIEAVSVSLCNPYAYSPRSRCMQATVRDEAGADSHQRRYLGYEWSRQIDLDRDPEEVLGARPPWRSGNFENGYRW